MNTTVKKVHLASFVKTNANLTRSEVIRLMEEGRILVNGAWQKLSYVVLDTDIVSLDNEVIIKKEKVYYIYNKPKGIICTNNKNIDNNMIDEVNLEQKVFCVGRLDKDTRGLVLLTNDGDFSAYITDPASSIEKEYIVTVKYPITDEFLKKMELPIIIKGKTTLPAKVIQINDFSFRIILKDGKYHQIRRLVINAKNTVLDLERIRIGMYSLDGIKEGKVKKINALDF